MDYANGKIYRLVCNKTGIQYIGSTTQPLRKRKNKHKSDYNRWLQRQIGYVSSFPIIEMGDYDIVLVEHYPCTSREELNSRERHFIDKLDCINKAKPALTRTQEELKEYQKQYRQDHKDQLKAYHQNYRKKHGDKISEICRQRYEQHREQLLTKVECECGNMVAKNGLLRHKRTKLHVKKIHDDI